MKMNSFLKHISIVLIPLIISNVLHMLIIKNDCFKWLKRPILKKAFGENKTWRGFLFVGLVNAIVLQAADLLFNLNLLYPFILGLLLGLAYMLFELPNSFMKRQLGIPSGAKARSNKMLFSLIDKMDSSFGVNLVYFLLGYVNYKYGIILFICSSLTHIFISKILVQLKLKKSF